MRLIFDHADAIALRLSDLRDERMASESALPADGKRQSFIAGTDPIELAPVLRSAPPLVKGGQGRTDEELSETGKVIACLAAPVVGLLIACPVANAVIRLSDAVGVWWMS
jgi:hypothetical protein